jgi:branched-chain amino acid transport system substrate-binding protein
VKTFRFFAVGSIIAILGALPGVANAHPTAQAASKGVIKIASHSPLSGGQSQPGIAIRNGVDLAIQQLSKPIKDLGFDVQLVPFDDQADPKVGPVNAQKIVSDPNILAVIGHYNSGVARPSSVIYNDNNLVMISPANTAVDITDRGFPTVNRVCGRDDAQGAAGAAYAVGTLKVKSVYIINDKSVYGAGVAKFFKASVVAAGVKVLGDEGTAETSNFDAIITPILSLKPDLVYFSGIYNQGSVFFNQARAKGVTAQFMGPDGFDASDTAKIGGDAVVGMVYTTTAAPASLSPDSATFRADYKKAFGEDAPAYAPEAYVATAIALKGIEKAINDNGGNMPDRKTVAADVRATKDFKSILGSISFDANGDPQYATYYVLKVGSSDPAKWGDNAPVASSQAPSPLTVAASATAAATMAATAAK